MKKIILLVAAVFVLVACKGPMSMVNLGKRTESVGLNPDVRAKEHVMKLKEFKIEDITENLEVGVPHHKDDILEYGMRYVFDNGAEATIGDGMLYYYNASAKYHVDYLNSLIDYTSVVKRKVLEFVMTFLLKLEFQIWNS